MCVYVFVCIYTYMCVCIYTYIYICVYIYVCVCICVYIYIYVCVYISHPIHPETGRAGVSMCPKMDLGEPSAGRQLALLPSPSKDAHLLSEGAGRWRYAWKPGYQFLAGLSGWGREHPSHPTPCVNMCALGSPRESRGPADRRRFRAQGKAGTSQTGK